MKEDLKKIKHSIISEHLGDAIRRLQTLITANPSWGIGEDIVRLDSDYSLMLSSLQQGMNDPALDATFHNLLQRAYGIYATVKWYVRKEQNKDFTYSPTPDFDIRACHKQLENFFADEALGTPDFAAHQAYINNVFNILTNQPLWSTFFAFQMEHLLLADSIDIKDRLLLITAVTLSAMGTFDQQKLEVLYHVYRMSFDVSIRTRALVGWVMAIHDDMASLYPEQLQIAEQAKNTEKINNDLYALQMLLVRCLNAERDQNIIEEEILPGLTSQKDASGSSVSPTIDIRIIEDPSEIDDFEERQEMEKRIEEMEERVEHVIDMQQEGADMYFGGFAMTKHHPFFNTLSNWFAPFYINHPDITRNITQSSTLNIAQGLLSTVPLCDSDKYSLALVIEDVVKKIPQNVAEMLSGGELKAVEAFMKPDDEVIMLRNYLQSLYRFFRISKYQKKFVSIFEPAKCLFITWHFFDGSPFAERIAGIAKILQRNELDIFLDYLIANATTRPIELMLIEAESFYQIGDPTYAAEIYSNILLEDPACKAAIKGLAKCYFHMEEYSEALAQYELLEVLLPDSRSVKLNKLICMSYTPRVREAIQQLAKIDFEQPGQPQVLSALGWAYLMENNLPMAIKRYNEAVVATNPQPTTNNPQPTTHNPQPTTNNQQPTIEYLHLGIALACNAEYHEAAITMTHFFTADDSVEVICDLLDKETAPIRHLYNLSTSHLQLIADITFKALHQ